ncbi:MAG: 50S ribosomal protein L35 [Phycisphaerae bacterium]
MPKMKTHKGLKKRVKLTASGKIKHRRANTGHLMSGKSGKRRRKLRQRAILDEALGRRMRVLLGTA